MTAISLLVRKVQLKYIVLLYLEKLKAKRVKKDIHNKQKAYLHTPDKTHLGPGSKRKALVRIEVEFSATCMHKDSHLYFITSTPNSCSSESECSRID